MKALVDSIPKFGSHNRSIKAKSKLTNTDIRTILEKSISQPAKAIDGYCAGTIYKIRRNYLLKDGDLYKRIENGN